MVSGEVRSDYFREWLDCYNAFIEQAAEGKLEVCKVYGSCRHVKVALCFDGEAFEQEGLAAEYCDAFVEGGFSKERIYCYESKYFFVFVLVE